MPHFQTLTAADGHDFATYVAKPNSTPHGAVVVIQEIFGVNAHIREVADRFAAAGYLAVAPALFDRDRPGIELAYDADGVAAGRDLKEAIDLNSEADVMAAITFCRSAGRVAAVGFCWGGSLAWRLACRADSELVAAISYYGGELPARSDNIAHCPVMAHFGIRDASIPEAGARAFAAAQPTVGTFFYDADHGFNCDHRAQYDASAANTAWARSLKFLADKMN